MEQVKLPQIKVNIKTLTDTPSNEEKQWIQVNPSCLLAYLGIRGYANTPSSGDWSGAIVCAKWSSTFDDDNCPQKLKTLSKKGSMITLVPHYKSTVTVTLIKDGDVIENLGDFETDIFTFERIDFTRFVFKSNAVTSDVFTKKKIKKYKRLQIVLESKTAEPFGITNVIKTYTIGNYAKK